MELNPDLATVDSGLSLTRVGGALIMVLGLVGGLAFLLRVAHAKGWVPRLLGPQRDGALGHRKITVLDCVPLDGRRKLISVAWGGKEHLLLLGLHQDCVVASEALSSPSSSLNPLPLPASDA